ncbi:hypothetical protein RP29_06210 [Acidovorax temperans]|uniref:Uncharacterized protein n=1 Tax=Acidovorax temperans TaxID=80878 RepID=A0A0D7KAB8_9BURK|nr:hypothetical protein RP29_06210 [Acidovorax temperans]
MQTVAEGRHGTSFPGFDEVVEADSIFLTLAQWNDPDGHERFEHDTIHSLLAQAHVSVAQALSKVLNAEDCHAGERLERAVLLEAALDQLTLLTRAVDGLPGTLEALRVLTTFAGARQFRDRPQPPIRRVDEPSKSQAGYRHSPRDIQAVFETLATQCEAVRDFCVDIRSRLQGDSGSVVEACNELTIVQHMVAFMGSMCAEMSGCAGGLVGGPSAWAAMTSIEAMGDAA